MSERTPEYDPHSRLEDAGIPDLQAGTPEQQWAVDPQEEPMPGDEPVGVDEYGTTADEQLRGESLAGRIGREVPEEQAVFGAEEELRIRRADDTGLDPDIPDRLDPRLTAENGLGVGADLDTDYQPDDEPDSAWGAQPEEPSGTVWDEPRRAGRLVDPDEGVREDTEPDVIAREVGPDLGGYTAEEAAMRVEPEEPWPPGAVAAEGGHVGADLEWVDSDADDPDGGSGRTEADDGGYLPGEGTGRPPA